jgi:hypothetical protein
MILRQGNPETAPDGVCARDFCGKQAIDDPIPYLNRGCYSVAEVINFLYDLRVWQSNMTVKGKQSLWHQQVLDAWKTADSETLDPKEWLQWFAAEYEWAELKQARISWKGQNRDLNKLRSIPDMKKGFSLHGDLWNLEAWGSSEFSMGGADLDLWQGAPAGASGGQDEGKESHNEPSRRDNSGSRHSPSRSHYSTSQGTQRMDLRSGAGAGGGGPKPECKACDCDREPTSPFEPHCSRQCKLKDGGVGCWVHSCTESATVEFDPACSYRCGQQWAWSNQQSQQPPETPSPSKDGSCVITWCNKRWHRDFKPFCSPRCKMSELGYPGATPMRRECQYLNCGKIATLEEFPFCSGVCRRKGEQPSHPMDREKGGDHRRKSIHEANMEKGRQSTQWRHHSQRTKRLQ